ncbi:XRE family transcriptional regulator [Streptomyces parvulus]|uniref:XRE family transcriptional regulator n=1 Tax=Streptomyces parvulus TaxID=146923 RepID=A0A369UWE2_9ACTN|nr:XRE family transcriptional regulator [Streptomyces parvulus]RDD85102.1 XRE family transcriptional regulator [Streptomyces parvulus]
MRAEDQRPAQGATEAQNAIPSHFNKSLQEMRARTGLSLAALAQRTHYSKSSWERYLNGKSLPPRQAVSELCRLAGEPDGHLLSLREIAEDHWSRRATVHVPIPSLPPPPSNPPALSAPRRTMGKRRLLVALAAAYVLLVGAVALALMWLPTGQADRGEAPTSPLPYSTGPQCRKADCEGQDPIRLICGINPDSLTTLRTATGAWIELRHSRKCQAGWGRIWNSRIGDRLELTGGRVLHTARVNYKDDTEVFVYTAMAAAGPGTTLRACFIPAVPTADRECIEGRVSMQELASLAGRGSPPMGSLKASEGAE